MCYSKQILTIIKQLLLLLLIYALCRILFFAFNHKSFADVGFVDFSLICIKALRFDISTIILTNAIYILALLLPFRFIANERFQNILKYFFVATNSIAILANCIDFAYFPYIQKRTTAEVFQLFTLGDDVWQLLPSFIIDFWFVPIFWILLTFVLFKLYQKPTPTHEQKSSLIKTISLFLVSIFVLIIGYRGGFQLKPISIISAAESTESKYIPLIINTPFSIIKTYGQGELEEKKYFDFSEISKTYNPLKAGSKEPFNKKNVVLIILESFSKEFIGSLSGRKTYTPFLDSLIKQSVVFENAFANGKKSMEGIPAIVAGIPTLMNEPYITSTYGSNKINSLPNLLKEQGFQSAFYHGGTNGTMGFDAFCNIAGYDKYIGRTEYNNEKDFDGNWGIWDDKFLQFFSSSLNTTNEPFFSTVFTLSSHHPYNVPNEFKSMFEEEELPIHKSIRYADYSLRKFFEEASKAKWYNNTLFVLVADHTGVSNDGFYNNSVGTFEIPIIFYSPAMLKPERITKVAQQIDIMPSVLSLLNYPKDYFAFGNNLFDSTQTTFAVQYANSSYQLINDTEVLQFDGTNKTSVYNYKADSLLTKNISGNGNNAEVLLKSIIQTYNNSLLKNKMTIEK